MDERAKAEHDDMRRMLETPGWIAFHRDATDKLEELEKGALDAVKTIEDLAYRKGVRDALRAIVHFEAFLDAMEQNDEDAPF